MSVLRVALRLILGVDICVHDTTGRPGGIRRSLPRTAQQLSLPQLFENDATPILRRPHRPQTALALATVLIAQHARLAHTIPAQPVRAQQPRKVFIDSADRLLLRYRGPDQPIHVFHRLDLRLDDAHLTFTIAPATLSRDLSIVYNTVVLGPVGKRVRRLKVCPTLAPVILSRRNGCVPGSAAPGCRETADTAGIQS